MGNNRQSHNDAFDDSKIIREQLINNSFTPIGAFPLKGTSEMVALNPGFYRLPPLTKAVVDGKKIPDRRPRIKFGFSW